MDTPVKLEAIAAEPPPEDSGIMRMPRPRRLETDALVLGGVTLVLAAILRFIRIGHREFFGDEFFALDFLTAKRPDMLVSIFHGHLPLYYEIVRGWGKLFSPPVSEAILRIPSAIFGLIACVAFFGYARKYLRAMAFALALLGFALNPTLVAVSNDSTSFALLSLWVVLSNFYCIRALDEGGQRHWIRYAVVSVLGALTHPLFWLSLLAQFIFAAARPAKTPRPFVLASGAGIFTLVAVMISAAVYAEKHFPKKLDVSSPALDDLVKGLVAVSFGNFPRYGHYNELLRALLYLFLFVCLGLSYVYYRKRAEEASSLPDNVVWIDETQDVVGNWKRLSLASFLMFHWMTFLIPAFGILVLGAFAPDLKMRPELFIVCLPSLVILIAAGIDAAPGRVGTLIMGLIYVLVMAGYDARVLADPGLGISNAFKLIAQQNFNAQKDVLIYVPYQGMARPVDRYGQGFKGVQFPAKEEPADSQKRLDLITVGKDRVFAFYTDDYRRIGKTDRSPVREWFSARKSEWDIQDHWEMSLPEKAELRIYRRRPAGVVPALPAASGVSK